MLLIVFPRAFLKANKDIEFCLYQSPDIQDFPHFLSFLLISFMIEI